MKLYPEYLSKDRPYDEGDIFPACDALEIVSHGCRLFGYTLTPGGKPGEKHPLVVVLHGFELRSGSGAPPYGLRCHQPLLPRRLGQ